MLKILSEKIYYTYVRIVRMPVGAYDRLSVILILIKFPKYFKLYLSTFWKYLLWNNGFMSVTKFPQKLPEPPDNFLSFQVCITITIEVLEC